MCNLTEWFNSSLKKIDHKIFKDVINVNLKLEPMGDGQVVVISEVKRAILTLETSRRETKHLKVIIKTEPNSEGCKAFVASNDIFATEAMMYTDVLKAMERLLLQKNIMTIWADSYICSDNKFVFQDLCEIGYRVVPTYKFLDVNHTLLVMKSIGQFHGLSLVMKDKKMLNLSNFKPSFYSQKVPFLINLIKMNADILVATMRKNWGPEWLSAAEKLEYYVTNPADALCNMCESIKGKWCVVNHGDFTMRNMLFHYPNDSTCPDYVKFVDFQGSHYSNFAFDLACLLYSSVRPKLRQDNMNSFLETYVNSLKETCLLYDYKEKLPSVEDAFTSLKELQYLTTITSLLNIPFFISSKNEGVQDQANEWFQKLSSEEFQANPFPYQGEQTLFNDSEITNEMKFEIQRMIDEEII